MAKLNVKTPDGKTLTIDVGAADPSQYPTIVDDVMKDYVTKQNLAQLDNQGPLDELKSFIPTSKQDLKDFADTTAAVGKTAAQGLGGIAALVSPLGNTLAGVPQPATDTTQLAAAIAKGTESYPGEDTIAGLLDPKYMALGEILGPLTGKVLSMLARGGMDVLGSVLALLSPNQSTKLLNFLRDFPEFFTYVKSLKAAPVELANAIPESTTTTELISKLKPSIDNAVSEFKLSPEMFVDKLKSIMGDLPEKIEELTLDKQAYLLAGAKIAMTGGSRSLLTKLLGASLVGKLVSLFFGPFATAIAGIGEYILGSPAGAATIQRGLGLASQATTAAEPFVSKVATAAPSVANAIRGAISDTKENQ